MRYPKYWIKIREKYPRICSVRCRRCDMNVKHENVWKVKTNHLNNYKASDGHHFDIEPVYYCKVCFPDKIKLTEYLSSTEFDYRFK